MNKQKFIEYLRKPSQITTDQLNEIESLVKEYPYFQDGRTLLAKAKKTLNPDQAAKFISTAAVYVSDRSMLKKYLNQELFFLKPLQIDAEKEEKLPETPKVNAKPEIEIAVSEKEIKQTASKTTETQAPAKIEDDSTNKTEIPSIASPQIKKSKPIDETFIFPTKSTDNLDDLIAEIMQDVAELKKSKARFRAIEAKIEEEDAIKKVISRTTSGKKKTLTNNLVVSKDQQTVVSDKPTEKITQKPSTASGKKKNEIQETITESSKEELVEVLVLKKEEQEQIIKEFIKTEPQIKKIKPGKSDAAETVNDLADKSTRFHVDVTSEYLAEIYIGQGKHGRAIEIYESLGLKFPEKSAYFAGLIENLKKKS